MESSGKIKAKVGVVGGGISGVAAAYYLEKEGYDVDILEATDQIGGRVGCDYLGERRIEFGGKNIGRKYPLFREFVEDIGDYSYEFFGINTSTLVNGKRRVINSEKKYSTLVNVIRLTGIMDFIKLSRLVGAVKYDARNGYLGGEYFTRLSDTYDHKPITEKFGRKFCRDFLRPIVVRMNGSEPDEYYIGNLGSNIKMILDSYDQLEDGLFSVVERFSERVRVRTNMVVTDLLRSEGGIAGVEVLQDGKKKNIYYDAVVLATPAPVAASIAMSCLPKVAKALERIAYNPVAIAVALYENDVFDKDARAIVFDEGVELSNAGAYGVDDLDIVRYTFSGRLARQSIDEKSDPLRVLELGEKQLEYKIGVRPGKRLAYIYRYFRNGLCAYAPHHHRVIKAIEDDLGRARVSNLVFAGDYLRGASIEACFLSAKEAVDRLVQAGRNAGSHNHTFVEGVV